METVSTAPQRNSTRPILLVTCLALATVVSAVASLNVAIPSIASDTHASQTQLSWIIDAYALVFAALLLPGGALGDKYGRRRALLAGLTVFGAGSAAAMAIAEPWWLIAMRAVLGLGAALTMPATLSTITSTFAPQEKARAVGTWAGVAGASAIIGLLVSGLVLEVWSWRAVFATNVALAAAAIICTLRVIPESADKEAAPVDFVGALITIAGLGALVYSIIEAPAEGWASIRTLLGMALSLVILAGFVAWELTCSHPMLDPRLFFHRAFSAGTVTITMQFLAFFGFIFLVLQYLQLVRGETPLIAAVNLLPLPLAMMPSARVIAPRLAARAGQLRTCTLGLVLITAGLAALSTLDQQTPYWVILAGLLPFGAGMGLAMTPSTAAITDGLPLAKQGVGSAVNDLARELGGALGIAILGSIMQSAYRTHLTLAGLPQPEAEQARTSFGMAAHIGGAVAAHARLAFSDGMGSALRYAAALALIAAVAVALLLRKRHSGLDTARDRGRSEQAPNLPGSLT